MWEVTITIFQQKPFPSEVQRDLFIAAKAAGGYRKKRGVKKERAYFHGKGLLSPAPQGFSSIGGFSHPAPRQGRAMAMF